ncbi:heat-inducible transcriptional repressor HrcA [bacterium]|nr:heat-inducible transcriptional repressor HrcA [bacterium]
MVNLKERRERVIETIVSSFLETAEPVGSSYVAAACGLGLSPATIRHIMKELEDEGYLAQPYTSAGRIPTVKCYRYYVSHLLPGVDSSDADFRDAKLLVERVLRENDATMFLSHIAKVLSEVTDLIGVSISPSFEQALFDRLEIVNMGGSRYLLVISLNNGLVKTIHLTVDKIIPRTKIDETARLLSARLHGLTVAEIKTSIDIRLRGLSGGDKSLCNVILNKRDEIFDFTGDTDFHIAGLSRLLVHPEFAPFGHTLKMIDLYEHKSELAQALNLTIHDNSDVNIYIGGSDFWGPKPILSMISGVFRSGSEQGLVAVIGPLRVHYPRLAAIVRYTAEITADFFSKY